MSQFKEAVDVLKKLADKDNGTVLTEEEVQVFLNNSLLLIDTLFSDDDLIFELDVDDLDYLQEINNKAAEIAMQILQNEMEVA